jgi:hypothetical protein
MMALNKDPKPKHIEWVDEDNDKWDGFSDGRDSDGEEYNDEEYDY